MRTLIHLGIRSVLAAAGLAMLSGCGSAGLPQAAIDELADLNDDGAAAMTLPFLAPPGTTLAAEIEKQGTFLSEAEKTQLQELRNQLDQGTLTPTDFATQADALLGDRFAPGREARGQRRIERVTRWLQLTDEQAEQARTIGRTTGRAVRKVMLESRAAIRLILTDEQRTRFDELRADKFADIRSDEPIERGPGRLAERRARRGEFLQRLADELQLTDDQRAQIRTLREGAREQAQTLRQTAREQFRALLTPEQTERLETRRARFLERHPRLADWLEQRQNQAK